MARISRPYFLQGLQPHVQVSESGVNVVPPLTPSSSSIASSRSVLLAFGSHVDSLSIVHSRFRPVPSIAAVQPQYNRAADSDGEKISTSGDRISQQSCIATCQTVIAENGDKRVADLGSGHDGAQQIKKAGGVPPVAAGKAPTFALASPNAKF
jgi:hypothetical protein